MPGADHLPIVDDAATVAGFLAPGVVRAEFQPIVRLADGRAVAWEALGRLELASPVAPDDALRLAEGVGRAADLEVAYWEAVAAAGLPPDGAALFVNCGAAGFGDPRMGACLAQLDCEVVVEITEHIIGSRGEPVLRELTEGWASRLGVRFAVDDAGAGYSSLRRVVDLAPDFVKLDASLVQGLADSPGLRAALDAMLGFAAAVGATLVAEGVERRADLQVLVDAGVPLVQGFLTGRPGAPWPRPTSEVVDLRSSR